MEHVTQVEAEPREEFGKNAARRLRRAGRIPAVLYGGGGPAISVTVDPKKISQILTSGASHNALFTLQVRGRAPARVMLPWLAVFATLWLDADLVRVATGAQLKVKVPIVLFGEAKGVKVQGGVLEFVTREVEVECLPDDIPERLSVDVTELTLGHNVRVQDLTLGPKVKLLTEPTRVVVHVVALKIEEEKPAAEVAVEAAPAEPEVIRKGKGEEEKGAEEAAGAEKSEKKEAKKEPKKESKKE